MDDVMAVTAIIEKKYDSLIIRLVSLKYDVKLLIVCKICNYDKMLYNCRLRFLNVRIYGNLIENSKIFCCFENIVLKLCLPLPQKLRTTRYFMFIGLNNITTVQLNNNQQQNNQNQNNQVPMVIPFDQQVS